MFFEHWRDNRECAMRSRACAQVQDAANTSTSDRLDVIRRRVAGVSDDTRGSSSSVSLFSAPPPPSSGTVRRDRSPQHSSSRKRARAEGLQLCRSYVISSYDAEQSSELPNPVGTHARGPRSCEPGICPDCGDSLSTQMHVAARGACGGSHVGKSASSSGVMRPSSVSSCADVRPVKKVPAVKAREGVSRDGFCLGCGDAITTPMHVQHGPCE